MQARIPSPVLLYCGTPYYRAGRNKIFSPHFGPRGLPFPEEGKENPKWGSEQGVTHPMQTEGRKKRAAWGLRLEGFTPPPEDGRRKTLNPSWGFCITSYANLAELPWLPGLRGWL